LDMYRSGDPYMAFAKRVGAIPENVTKKMFEEPQYAQYAIVRERYKVMLLAVQYGMMVDTLAARLGISTFEAHEMLQQHHQLFAQYWQWSDDWVQHSLQTGTMCTPMGWQCCTGITEFNERSIRNWPIQATGADILRIACILATRHGIRLLAPVHDAVLIEAPIERIEDDVALMQEIMRRASRIVLNADASGTHELRTDVKIVRYPDRYTDKRGDAIWVRVMELLREQRNQPTRLRGGHDMTSEADKRRLAELQATTQAYLTKRKKRKDELFVRVPLWWAVEAAKATGTLKMLVLLELLHRSWKARDLTFPFPNGSLGKTGVGREAKRRVLRDLEAAKLVTIERRHGKTPMVTLVTL
jgi:DNA polymerase family A